jgi:hypothetical protein
MGFGVDLGSRIGVRSTPSFGRLCAGMSGEKISIGIQPDRITL